jgi:L-lactate dehydrogenase complex protein LldG
MYIWDIMASNGFLSNIKNFFSSEKKEPDTIKDVMDQRQEVEDFTTRVIKTTSVRPEEEKPKVFLRYVEKKKMPKALDVKFAKNFCGKQGRFIYCENHAELVTKIQDFCEKMGLDKINIWEAYTRKWLEDRDFVNTNFVKDLEDSKVAISLCEGLIADEGSIMLSAEQNSRRGLVMVFPKVHIIIAHSAQLKIDVEHGLEEFTFRYNDGHPFLFQLEDKISKYRHIANKLIINSEGTKDVYVFYSEEPIVFE